MLNNKEIVGMSEAYKAYMLLPQELQELIPQDFVNEMKQYYKEELGAKIKEFSDINAQNVSEEGIKNIAYIRSFI